MLSATLIGPTAKRVQITAVAGPGHGIHITGLPGREVREAAARVTLAIEASGFQFPRDNGHVTVQLAPSDVAKSGAALDLGIALGVLSALKVLPGTNGHLMALGELGLTGTLEHTRGILALAAAAPRGGTLVVPDQNLREATLARLQDNGLTVLGAESFKEAIAAVKGQGGKRLSGKIQYPPAQQHVRMEDIIGHADCKEAIMAAGVGGLHVILDGPPGTGKSLLAKASPGILPKLSAVEALEVTRIWSASGHLQDGMAVYHPPYVAINPNTSLVGLLGGGPNAREIGAVSRAHMGVLHIDEMQEMPRSVIDSLRSVMEDGVAVVGRMGTVARILAKCQIVATVNPCPCGWHGLYVCRDCGRCGTSQGSCPECGGASEGRCTCTKADIQRVQRRMSGPIMDRFDVKLKVGTPVAGGRTIKSKEASKRVAEARKRLATKLSGRQVRDVPGYEIAALFPAAMKLVENALPGASMRRRHRTLKLAMCFSALDGSDEVAPEQVKKASALAVGN